MNIDLIIERFGLVGLCLVGMGFAVLILWKRLSEVSECLNLAASYVWISSAVAARAIYWAYAPEALRTYLGKGLVNCTFTLALIYGGYLVLKLLWLLIPDIDRSKYSILTAPLYPASSEWRLAVLLNLLRNTRRDE